MKPRRPLSEMGAFRRTIDRYTGRRVMMKPLRPITRLIPSPARLFLGALKW